MSRFERLGLFKVVTYNPERSSPSSALRDTFWFIYFILVISISPNCHICVSFTLKVILHTRQTTSTLQLNVESNPESLWLCVTLLCDWFRKLVPLSQPITFITEVSSVFPRFVKYAYIYSLLFLYFLCSDWTLRVLQFCFSTLQSKAL